MSTNKDKLEALLKLINSAAHDAIAEYEKVGDDVPFIDSTGAHPLDNMNDQLALRSAIRTLEGAYAQLSASLAPPAHTARNLTEFYDQACIRVVLREKIADILVDHPNGIHVSELSKILEIHPNKLARVLRLLATRGCFNEVETDTFANNRLSLMLHSSNPVSHMIKIHVEFGMNGAAVLYETLKDPKTAFSEDSDHSPLMYVRSKEGFNGNQFDWMRQQAAQIDTFQQAMIGFNKITGPLAILTYFPFEKYSTVVDVGGGVGGFALPLAQEHKHIEITIQDLPETLTQARGVWKTEHPEIIEEKRVEFVDLDFFVQVPVKGKDLYYLRSVIHDWPDHKAVTILRNVRQALGPHSRVLIHDHVLPELTRTQAEGEATSLGPAVAPEPMLPNFGVGNVCMYEKDMTMWVILNSKERTLQNFLQLSNAAGLRLEKIWDLVETCVLEFSAA